MCEACHPTCLTCDGPTESDCLTCSENKLEDSTTEGNKCICKDGYYLDTNDYTCKECSYKCKTCKSENECTECSHRNREMPECNPCESCWVPGPHPNPIVEKCHYSC